MENPEVRELHMKIVELEAKIKEYESQHYGLNTDDMYEFLVAARLKAMNEKVQDALRYTVNTYRTISGREETMKKVLDYFDGNTIKEKKAALHEFLKQNPAMRTTDPILLLQRLRIMKKYQDIFSAKEIPEHPIEDAIRELSTPPPISDPKDEDFLE